MKLVSEANKDRDFWFDKYQEETLKKEENNKGKIIEICKSN